MSYDWRYGVCEMPTTGGSAIWYDPFYQFQPIYNVDYHYHESYYDLRIRALEAEIRALQAKIELLQFELNRDAEEK